MAFLFFPSPLAHIRVEYLTGLLQCRDVGQQRRNVKHSDSGADVFSCLSTCSAMIGVIIHACLPHYSQPPEHR